MISLPDERQREFDSLRATASQREAAVAKVRKVTSVEVAKQRSDRDSTAACHYEFSVSNLRIVKARGKRKHMAPDAFAKFRIVYDESRKVRVESHVAEWWDFRTHMASVTIDYESTVAYFLRR